MNSFLKILFSASDVSYLKHARPLTYAYLSYCRGASLSKFLSRNKSSNAEQNTYRRYGTSLFISDKEDNVSSYFNSDHNLKDRLENRGELEKNLQLRGISMDTNQLIQDYGKLCELEKEKSSLEKKRADVAHQIASIVKHQKDQISKSKEATAKMKQLIDQGKELKMSFKDVMVQYWDVQEKVILAAMSLPNTIKNVPERLEVLEEYGQNKQPSQAVEHLEILKKSHSVRLSNVGENAYYLTGRLAVLEQELIQKFCFELRSENYIQMLAPEMFKTPVVEAGGLKITDHRSIYRLKHKLDDVKDWDSDHMFLQGASHLSFLAYFARMRVNNDDLPLKMFVVGRNYRPESYSGQQLPGLFGVSQSVKVNLCSLCSSAESSLETVAEFKSILTNIYKQFQLPYRVVAIPASDLSVIEQNRIELQIYVPSIQQYLKAASVSEYGDYSSRRLMIRHGTSKEDNQHPAFMVSCEVADITKMIAVLLEYGNHEQYWGT